MTHILNSNKIAQLNVACHYWAMAQGQNDSKAAVICYKKAYAILRMEMGEMNPSTLELRKEMTEFLSHQTASQAVARER